MRAKLISETMLIDQDDAICKQEITYSNNGDKPLLFTGISETFFHANCVDFHFEPTNGPIFPRKLTTEVEPYQTKFLYELSGEIQPGESAKLVLNYKWPLFKNEYGFERIATHFDSLTSYNLKIVVNDDTFTNHLISVRDGDKALHAGVDYHIIQDGSFVLYRQHLSQNAKMDVKITARIRKIELPLIDDVIRMNVNAFHGLVVFTVIHLLRDSLPFLHALIDMGVQKDDLFIIGIPYSSKDEVYEYLNNSEFKVFKCGREGYLHEFQDLVRRTLKWVCEHCGNTGKQLLIIEDGGYIVPLLHDEFKDCLPICLGAVEQTANGIWADRELADARRLSVPVVNVAESRIKKERESPLVGKAIIQNIARLLEGYGFGLGSQRVGQIGFGTIGQALAEHLKNDAYSLVIYDDDPVIRDRARRAGLNTVETLGELFPNKTLIVGCTGREVVGLNELRSADRNIFFVNATSKLRELRYLEFLRITERTKIVRGVGTEYRLKGGRRITIRLLADGFPVNFFESSESIPDREIQFIPALLLAAAAYLVTKPITEHEIIPIPDELESQLEEAMALHDETQ